MWRRKNSLRNLLAVPPFIFTRAKTMAKYILLSKLTTKGRYTLKNNPGRIMEVNKEIEELGVIVLKQYPFSAPTTS